MTLDQIVCNSYNLFKRKGVKATTTDEISHSLTISKKSLYKAIGSKNNLVKKTIDQFHLQFVEKIYLFPNPTDLEKSLIDMTRIIRKVYIDNEMFFKDLRINYSEISTELHTSMYGVVANVIRTHIENAETKSSPMRKEQFIKCYTAYLKNRMPTENYSESESNEILQLLIHGIDDK